MKTNTIKRAFAALAVSAVALSASAITASAETAKGYTSTGKAAADFKGAALDLTQKTISLDEAKNVQTIVLAAKGDGTQFDSTGIHIKFDAGLELVQTEYMEEKVWAAPQTAVKTYEAVQDGTDGLFLTFANSTPKAATTAGLKLWAFDVKVKNPEAGKKYPIEIAYEDGDLFDLKGSADTEAIRDYAFSNVTQGYIEIVAPTTTTTTATTTTTSTTSTTSTSTTSTTTTSGSKTTTSAKTTTKPVSTTKPKDNSPKTGVPGAGIAVAGLAVAIGTAFVLRKKED